jgi:orotidine-5'-phosphate decarboxylase
LYILREYHRLGHFVTVHGNDDILKAAVQHKNGMKILAVTVLTSLDDNDLKSLGFECDVGKLVESRARRALAIGCSGVISSGREAEALRDGLGENFLIVTPGIRSFSNSAMRDDQKRTVDVEQAFRAGADYIVVGRPIRTAPDPKVAAEEHQAKIRSIFGV